MHAIRKTFLVCLLVILALLIPLAPAFEHAGPAMDEGSLLVYPEQVLKGKLPYRDFETFYGPANLWVLSAAYLGFGPNIFVERAVGMAYRILIFVAIFALVQRWSKILAAGCTFLTGLIILPTFLPAYAWWGGIMCGLWSIWMIATGPESKQWCFWGGILGGSALLFRVDLGPAMIVSGLPLSLLMQRPQRRSYLAGAVIVLLPLACLVVASPGELLNNLLLFPVIRVNPARHLPIFSADSYVVYLFFAHLIAVTTNLLVGAVAVYANRRDTAARLLLGLALFGLCLTHQAAQRIDLLHVVYAAFLSIGILPLSIFVALQLDPLRAMPSRRGAVLATAIVAVLLNGFVPELRDSFYRDAIKAVRAQPQESAFIIQHGRSYPLESAGGVLILGKILNQLDTLASPGDRLFVGPADLRRTYYNDTFIYYMMPHLRPSTYFLEMNPQSANRPNSRLAADVASADWLLLNHDFDSWNEQNDSSKFGSDAPMRVVAQQFELCGRCGPHDLYRRKHVGL
jgi:hypothetical protein